MWECKQIVPHREYRFWLLWRFRRLSRPDRTEWYLARLMSLVASLGGKAHSPNEFIMDFQEVGRNEGDEAAEPLEFKLEEAPSDVKLAMSKAAWAGRLKLCEVEGEWQKSNN